MDCSFTDDIRLMPFQAAFIAERVGSKCPPYASKELWKTLDLSTVQSIALHSVWRRNGPMMRFCKALELILPDAGMVLRLVEINMVN